MPFFEVKQESYPESNAAAEHLVGRFGAELIAAVLDTMLEWINDDRQPGRQEVELVGTEANQEMVIAVSERLAIVVKPIVITKAWIAARKAGYREMRDGRFDLFVTKVKAAAARRK
jgi:hypothetical protein